MPHKEILVLEDHADLCAQICQILTDAGYAVQSAMTGAEALEAGKRRRFDLVVADLFLPDSSGMQVFKELCSAQPDLAGIVITGYSSWETAMEALRSGFAGFLVKPFVPEQLVAAVVNALQQDKLRRENARLRAIVPLYELSRAFVGTVELPVLLDQVLTTARQGTNAESGSLLLCDADHRELHIAASVGLPPEIVGPQTRLIGKGIAGRVAATGRPLIIAEGMPLDADLRELLLGRSELLSALSLPLISRGQVIGVLNLSRLRGREPFTAGDLELATVLASQAAISIDNARLFQQLKLLSEVSQQLARSVDLTEAVDAIVAGAIELTQARGAALWLLDGEPDLKMIRAAGLEDSETREPAPPRMIEQFQAQGDGGWVTVPLRYGENPLGALVVRIASTLAPDGERMGLLRTLAHTASATIESYRLRASEVSAFREVDRAVRSNLSVRQQLERLLEQMVRVCSADNGAIFLWNQADDRLEGWVTRGQAVPEELARAILREGRVGLLADERDHGGVAMGAPLRVGNRVEGAAVLTRAAPARPFTTRQLDLLSTLASSAALIVRNTQLYARSEEAAIAEERTRIAREIHDGLAQDLSFLVLKASAAQKLLGRGEERELVQELREITDQLRQDAREVRRVIFALRPLDIEALGFRPALEKFIKEFAQANDIETHLAVRGEASRLPPKLETALFRLAQEALNNVRKHAHAKQAWVELDLGEIARLSVRDDGRGFNIEQAARNAQTRGSVGLVQMRERAERAGGTFQIESHIDGGTCIAAELPIREL